MKKPVIGITCGIEIVERSSEREVLLDAYSDAVERAGAVPLILPNTHDPSLVREMAERLDGVLLTGGMDADPRLYGARADQSVSRIHLRRDSLEIGLARHVVRETRLPVFGICRGLQILNIALGGDLIVDLPSAGFPCHSFHDIYGREAVSHEIRIEPGSLLAGIAGQEILGVNSFHHQAVKTPAPGLAVTARSVPDGVIEALELPGDRFVLGVQWHPEGMTEDAVSRALFRRFTEAAAR